MSKQTAYEEMCRKEKGIDGKYTFSFDEIADIAQRHLGKSKKDTLKLLSLIAKEQEGGLRASSHR